MSPRRQKQKQQAAFTFPIQQKKKPQAGKVIAVGNGKKDEPMELKVGDEVLYGKYSGTEINVDTKIYLMMRQSDILAVVK